MEIKEATVSDIRNAFDQNRLTSRQLVEFYLGEINRLNSELKGVIQVNPDALKLSDEADEERKTKKNKPCPCSLHRLAGIPVLVKDNIATKDNLNTTAGSFALLGSVVPQDAGVVKKLRKAGAIILGKANLTEWANMRSSKMTPGWSARGGQTVNPYDKSAGTNGSSSGSAVSVAANLVTVSLGTETNGSILAPANQGSVVGFKPTVGLTSRAGVVPISPRMDTVGTICRTVADAVVVLDAIVGYDPDDAEATLKALKYIPRGGYSQFLKRDGLRGKRLGVLKEENLGFEDPGIQADFEPSLKILRERGAVLVEIEDVSNFVALLEGLDGDQSTIMNADFKLALNAYLSQLTSSPVRSLAEAIAFNNSHSEQEEIGKYGQDYFEAAEKTNGIGDTERLALVNITKANKLGFEKLMKDYNLDALMTPYDNVAFVLASGGYPGIIVPAGYENEVVPIGISFGGLKGSEPTLIEIAYDFEQSSKFRMPPKV